MNNNNNNYYILLILPLKNPRRVPHFEQTLNFASDVRLYPKSQGSCTGLSLRMTYEPICWGCCHVYLVKNHSHPSTSLLQGDMRMVLKFGNTVRGKVWRAGAPAAGHWLHPTADKLSGCGEGSRPLLPLPSSSTPQARLGPRAADPSTFAQSKEQLTWPWAVPMLPALCTGFAQGFPPLPHHGTPRPALFPARPGAAAGMAALRLPVLQPAVAPVKVCWVLWKFLEGQKHPLSSRPFPMVCTSTEEGASWLAGRGNPRHGWAFPISLWLPPGSAIVNGWVNNIFKYWLRSLTRMWKDARKQGFG